MTLRTRLPLLGLLTIVGCGELWDGFAKNCQQNTDCPSALCVDVQLGSYAPGACVPTEAVLYVDWDHCGTGAQNGTPGRPFCEVQNAIATIHPHDQQLHIIQVKPSLHQYAGVTIPQGNLALIGPWADPKLKGTQWDQQAAAMLVGSAAPNPRFGLNVRVETDDSVEAIVDGLAILGVNTGLGVDVENFGQGSKLTLRRTVVSSSSGYGVYVNNPGPATLTMDRCKVTGSQLGALGLSSEVSMFTITNSLFTGNGKMGSAAAIYFNTTVEGIFDHNTVHQNGGQNTAGGIDCEHAQSIANSIVLGNSHGNGSQFLPLRANNCRLHNTIVDDKDEDIQDGLQCNLVLADGSLLDAELGRCAIDKATDNPDRSLDYFGTRRPQGAHSDMGFHELVRP